MDKRDFSNIKTLVVKLGTSIMTDAGGRFSETVLEKLIHQILRAARSKNIQLIIVTSGAIGLGMEILGLKKRPKALAALQACAAVGQGKLMGLYEEAFSKVGRHTAQILLTREEFEDRKLNINVRRTLLELLKRGVTPVINENDTVATQEIQFGDNDTLSALVACGVKADLAVILSDVEGFFLKDKTILSRVEGIDEIEALHGHLFTRKREHTVGGMTTKLRAAKMLIHSGLSLLIADGRSENILEKILRGDNVGTLFVSSGKRIAHKDEVIHRNEWVSLRPQKGKA